MPMDVYLSKRDNPNVQHGDKVVIRITDWALGSKSPAGELVEVLGRAGENNTEMHAILAEYGLPYHFEQKVEDAAQAIPSTITKADYAARRDFRKITTFTIDPADAKDFDDAVYCESNRQGLRMKNRSGYRLVVAIADVSHYVRPGTPLDDEAQKRATSVYFPGYVVPMLPETLSNGICSLNPKVDRMCFVCDMQVNSEGEVTQSKFYEAVMRSHARLTYTDVWNAVGEGIPDDDHAAALAKIGPLLPQVQRLHQLYKVLDKARAKRGAIEFESSEVRFVLDAQGAVTQAGMLQRNDAHKLIEECMIAANVQAALFLLGARVPAPYRDHDKPPESKYADLEEFLKEFALRLPPWDAVIGKLSGGEKRRVALCRLLLQIRQLKWLLLRHHQQVFMAQKKILKNIRTLKLIL